MDISSSLTKFEEHFFPAEPGYGLQHYQRRRTKGDGQFFTVREYPVLVPTWKVDPDSRAEYCWHRDICALEAAAAAVPRVPSLITWKNSCSSSSAAVCVITESVDGQSLAQWLQSQSEVKSISFEHTIKTIAVELMETVSSLHCGRRLAHLNISTDCIAMLEGSAQPWDHIRLLGFGFSKKVNTETDKRYAVDYAVCNVKPASVFCTFGAPEHVRSVYLQRTRGNEDEAVMMNGPAADMWSVGIVAYVMLTGHHPFGTVDNPSQVSVERIGFEGFPCRRDALQDQRLLSVMHQHAEWEKALAEGRDHPLLQRVRQCSATPRQAVNFFRKILSPCPQCRLGAEALFHGYLRAHTYQMQSEINRCDRIPDSVIRYGVDKYIADWVGSRRMTPPHEHHALPSLECSHPLPEPKQQPEQQQQAAPVQEDSTGEEEESVKPSWGGFFRKVCSAAKAAVGFCRKFASRLLT